jgi:hypothetical protein
MQHKTTHNLEHPALQQHTAYAIFLLAALLLPRLSSISQCGTVQPDVT